jgi:lambda repressor-like predicted transcriptional regulator
MGMLNKQKNIQIAALNARGMTVEAIAKKAGVDVQAVKESLEERQRTYIELAAMSEAQKREYIANLQSKGKSVSEIAELTGLNAKKVNEIIFKKA